MVLNCRSKDDQAISREPADLTLPLSDGPRGNPQLPQQLPHGPGLVDPICEPSTAVALQDGPPSALHPASETDPLIHLPAGLDLNDDGQNDVDDLAEPFQGSCTVSPEAHPQNHPHKRNRQLPLQLPLQLSHSPGVHPPHPTPPGHFGMAPGHGEGPPTASSTSLREKPAHAQRPDRELAQNVHSSPQAEQLLPVDTISGQPRGAQGSSEAIQRPDAATHAEVPAITHLGAAARGDQVPPVDRQMQLQLGVAGTNVANGVTPEVPQGISHASQAAAEGDTQQKDAGGSRQGHEFHKGSCSGGSRAGYAGSQAAHDGMQAAQDGHGDEECPEACMTGAPLTGSQTGSGGHAAVQPTQGPVGRFQVAAEQDLLQEGGPRAHASVQPIQGPTGRFEGDAVQPILHTGGSRALAAIQPIQGPGMHSSVARKDAATLAPTPGDVSPTPLQQV